MTKTSPFNLALEALSKIASGPVRVFPEAGEEWAEARIEDGTFVTFSASECEKVGAGKMVQTAIKRAKESAKLAAAADKPKRRTKAKTKASSPKSSPAPATEPEEREPEAPAEAVEALSASIQSAVQNALNTGVPLRLVRYHLRREAYRSRSV